MSDTLKRLFLTLLPLHFFSIAIASEGAFPLFASPDQPAILGVGGSSAPVAGGAGAIFVNPAGLSRDASSELYLSMGWLYEGIQRRSVAIALPMPAPLKFKNRIWFGTAVSSITYSSMERRTGPSSLPQGEYGATDNKVSLAVSARPYGDLHVGLGVNYLESRISDYDAWGSSLNLGASFAAPQFGLETGISALNIVPLGSSANLGGDPMRSLQLGLRWSTFGGRMAASAAMRWDEDQDTNVLGGLEYVLAETWRFRAGRVFGHYSAGYSAGFGGLVHDLGLDYSFEEYGEGLGSTHRIGLRWKL